MAGQGLGLDEGVSEESEMASFLACVWAEHRHGTHLEWKMVSWVTDALSFSSRWTCGRGV